VGQGIRLTKTHFVIRVSDKVYVGHSYFGNLLHALPLEVGKRIWLEGLLYRQDRVVKINLLAIWGIGQKEPRYLATTLSDPNLVYRLYRKRVNEGRAWIQGLGTSSKVENPQKSLCAGSALSYNVS